MQAESTSGPSRLQGVDVTPPPPDSFPDSGLLEDLPARELHRGLFHLLFGREPAPDDPFVAQLENGTTSPRQLMEWLIHSAEWSHSAPMTEFGPSLHYGRGVFIRSLPRARRILDIGGVALGVPYGALVLMGYPYAFEEIVIVDLPSEDRHELYQDGQTQTTVDVAGGRVSYRYHSMTDLSSYPSASFDMVYSGESIEHITRAEAEQVLREARRVLKPGGVLALDTPNANLTRLQQDAFIDPDHKYEYRHAEMAAMLRGNGFVIERAEGINYGGDSVARGVFEPTELATKRGIFDDIENCYLLAYVCRKPHRPTVGTSLNRAWWSVAGTQTVPRRALGKARRMLAR
jgi:SAM-dependent methyltransferase